MSRRSGKDDFDIFKDINDLDEDDLSFDDFSDDLPEDDPFEDPLPEINESDIQEELPFEDPAENPTKIDPEKDFTEKKRTYVNPRPDNRSFREPDAPVVKNDPDDFDDYTDLDDLDDPDSLDDFDDLDDDRDDYFDDQSFDEVEEERPVRQRQSREVNRRRTSSIKKTSPLDDFREWLSDYLIYFMLGGVVLIILLVVIFTARGCAKKNNPDSETDDIASTSTVEDPENSPEDEEPEVVITNPLTPADSGIVGLVNERFAALASGNVDGVRALQTDLSAVDEQKITADADKIDSYNTKAVYTKEGMEEGSYVTYVSFDINYTGYDTPDPSLDELYIITTGDGNFIVDTDAQSNPDIVAYTNQLWEDADLKDLLASVKSEHDAALAKSPELSTFLSEMGEEVTAAPGTEDQTASAEDDGPRMTVTDNVNMRSEPGGDVIDGIPYGTSVKVFGRAGENLDWYQVEYNGQTGYVYSDYLTEGSGGSSDSTYSEDDYSDYDEYY